MVENKCPICGSKLEHSDDTIDPNQIISYSLDSLVCKKLEHKIPHYMLGCKNSYYDTAFVLGNYLVVNYKVNKKVIFEFKYDSKFKPITIKKLHQSGENIEYSASLLSKIQMIKVFS